MPDSIPLRCRCGNVRGVVKDVSPSDRAQAVCYCDDCQIYALHLDREDTLDARGGTRGVMTTPAQVTITQGQEQLRCLRLSQKGLYRYYAACCKTPIANLVGPRLPVLILPTVAVDAQAVGKSPDDIVGPPAARIQGQFARGGVPPDAHRKIPVSMLPGVIAHVVKSFARRRTQPSAFFDPRGHARAQIELIDRNEREAIRKRVLEAARA